MCKGWSKVGHDGLGGISSLNDPVIQSSFPESSPDGAMRGCQSPEPLSCVTAFPWQFVLLVTNSSWRAGGDGLGGAGLLHWDLGLLVAAGNRKIHVSVELGFGQLS